MKNTNRKHKPIGPKLSPVASIDAKLEKVLAGLSIIEGRLSALEKPIRHWWQKFNVKDSP